MAQQNIQNFNKYIAITPNDTADLPQVSNRGPDAIWVGGAGIVSVATEDGVVVNFTVTAGTLLPIKARRVNALVTTATLMVGLWQL